MSICRPVRREGGKWEAGRLGTETLFILGSRANKALGFGQTRGRLYIKHPELFKYSGDQTDKEWLAKASLMATTGGKVCVATNPISTFGPILFSPARPT
jgi:deoxynucleotidyltransferase terminal-interacting protein 1